jgi:hypothetical protein
VITTELALAWATLPPATDSNWHRHRLAVVRGFATHLHAIDPRHEVTPADLLVWRKRRAVAYIHTDVTGPERPAKAVYTGSIPVGASRMEVLRSPRRSYGVSLA